MTVLLPMLVFWLSMVVIYAVWWDATGCTCTVASWSSSCSSSAALLARVHVGLTVCLLVAALASSRDRGGRAGGARRRARVLAELGD